MAEATLATSAVGLGALGEAGEGFGAGGGGIARGSTAVEGGIGQAAAAQGQMGLVRVGKTVLGHYPDYVAEAERLGGRYLNLPEGLWTWEKNKEFLWDTILRGDDIVLATPYSDAKPTRAFFRELQYLLAQGFRPDPEGTRMLPPGAY
jgi:hypothetical protein